MKNIYLLAIESSCDDTSAAVLHNGKILSNVIANQKIHEEFGGIVPELASRSHEINIIPVVEAALKRAGVTRDQLSAIAFTRGPGLIGSLLVGTTFAKAMALGLGIPIIEVNHMQAHVLAHFIEEPKPGFPFLCLTVSGGHTQIVLVRDYLDMEVIGQTIDDAAGEAFDKTGKLLGLSYPAGPVIDRLAKMGDPHAFEFPKPKVKGLDFSFSGLKTSIRYFLRDRLAEDPQFIEKHLNDICASVQHTIISILLGKLRKAARKTGIKEVAIAGGVSANSELRARFEQLARKEGWNTYIPAFQYCTDNAAMIAIAGYFKYLKSEFAGQDINPVARYPF